MEFLLLLFRISFKTFQVARVSIERYSISSRSIDVLLSAGNDLISFYNFCKLIDDPLLDFADIFYKDYFSS